MVPETVYEGEGDMFNVAFAFSSLCTFLKFYRYSLYALERPYQQKFNAQANIFERLDITFSFQLVSQ